tara:strand:+ start:173 stop:772 length:600 start_codon:yes stop_codon:yes gene_type:complete
MAELEYQGIKLGGSKLLLILPLLGTLGGVLWGGFEAYQRYLSMEEKISEFVSPDLSKYDQGLIAIEGEFAIIDANFAALDNIVNSQIKTLKENVASLQTANLDLRMDVNQDRAETQNSLEVQINRVEDNLDKQEIRNRSNIEDVRGVINAFEVRFESTINSFEERMDTKMSKLDTKLDDLEEALDKKIQRAIDNPLAGK